MNRYDDIYNIHMYMYIYAYKQTRNLDAYM